MKLGKGVELAVHFELLAGAAKGERMANLMVKGEGMGTFHHIRMNVAPSTGAKIPCDGHPWPLTLAIPLSTSMVNKVLGFPMQNTIGELFNDFALRG